MIVDQAKNQERIESLLAGVDRRGMGELISYLQNSDFFKAPCSTKFHLNYAGGLAQHSLCVYDTLCKLCDTFHIDIGEDTKIITALLHDVCKIGLYHGNGGRGYKKIDKFPVGHGEKSVMRILQCIDLSDQEMMMIRWHMSMYDDAFFKNSFMIQNSCPEAFLLYFADHISTLFIESATVKDGYY
jgi:hypothetical protein